MTDETTIINTCEIFFIAYYLHYQNNQIYDYISAQNDLHYTVKHISVVF
jgi:hypothetical protein